MKIGVLSNGVLTEVLTTVTRQLMMNSGKFNYRTALGLCLQCSSGQYRSETRIVREFRRSAIIDFDLILESAVSYERPPSFEN